jgi:hypothetical protein
LDSLVAVNDAGSVVIQTEVSTTNGLRADWNTWLW